MEKIYQINYVYEFYQEEYVNEDKPLLGTKRTTSFTERAELIVGKTPTKALKNWLKLVNKRKETKRVRVTEIKEYIIEQSNEE